MSRRLPRRRVWLGLYCLLVVLSHGWQAWVQTEAERGSHIEVRAVARGTRQERTVPVAYAEWRTRAPETVSSDALPLVLLHGSPGSRSEVTELGRLLADGRRCLAPDLPGFGASKRSVPDYSIVAHADYVDQLLEALSIERAHVLGFSMGGGVALELARNHPDRVASVVLLGSIGVQEFELLGDYHLNHAIHAAQLAALWGLHNLVPHFGLLEGFLLDVPYARNFYDSDQRPLAKALEAVAVPVLVVHGERDALVPLAAALEHHRRVPQSELVLYEGGHFVPFMEPSRISGEIGEFLARADSGSALGRDEASPVRLARAAEPLDLASLPRAIGPTLLVWMLLLALATLVSEDLTCIAAGLLVAQGRLEFVPATVACAAGIFIGDLALYLAGRWLGRPWLTRAPLKWLLDPRQIERSSEWFARRGAAVIFLSRFWPGMRLPTYVAAGMFRTSFPRFAGLFGLAVAVWTPLLVGASAWLGERWLAVFEQAQGSIVWLALVAVLLAWILAMVRRLATPRGRRLWVGDWRRRLTWEFWPLWIFYAPVVLRIGWLMLRFRSATLFTAANPGIPEGGFVGESKSRILEALPIEAVARFTALPARDGSGRLEAVRRFVEENGLRLPVVLKPDVGQRGEGVTIARSHEQIEAALSAHEDLVAQEYVPGVEAGVFYVRPPGDSAGSIFSLTLKRLAEVEGDGSSTIEELILADERAVCLARTYLAGLDRPAKEIPQRGERVRLVEVGTHCRGAIFDDGAALITPELTAAVDRISRHFEGFHFGRYDLKAPTEGDLRAGRNLKVIELNGVTSEATHIYGTEGSLFEAYRVLFRQWEMAFEIGAANRSRGASVTPLSRLLRLGWSHLTTNRGESGS